MARRRKVTPAERERREQRKRRKELRSLRSDIQRRNKTARRREARGGRRAAAAERRRIATHTKKRKTELRRLKRDIQRRDLAARRQGIRVQRAERKRLKREKQARARSLRRLRTDIQRRSRLERAKMEKAAKKADKAYYSAKRRAAAKARQQAGVAARKANAAHAKAVSDSIRSRKGIIAEALARIGTLIGAEVAVGFTGQPGRADHGGETVATVAYENEYGIGVPERPFMRSTNARCRSVWVRGAGQIVAGLGKGSVKVEQGLRRLGLRMVADVKQTINSNMQPPNSPATVKRKRSAKTLIDTGQMINSVRAELVLPDGFRELLG